MNEVANLTEEKLTRALAHVGLVFVAFELAKRLTVNPIKAFYRCTTFGIGAVQLLGRRCPVWPRERV